MPWDAGVSPSSEKISGCLTRLFARNRLQATVGCLGDTLCGQFDPSRHQRACVAVCSGYLVEVGNRTVADLSDLGTLPFIGQFEKMS